MKRFVFLCLVAWSGTASAQWKYPPTKTVTATDTYFGKTYKDPYRWLENLKDEAVQAWFKAQASLTDDALAKIPGRDALATEWAQLDKLQPARYYDIQLEHGRVFYKKTLGGENVGKLYYREGWHGAEKLLFDPSAFKPRIAKPGDITTIEGITPSPDGKYVLLGFSAAGGELSELRVLDVAKRELLADSIYPSYSGNGWTPDSTSFLYDGSRNTDIKSPDFELNRKTLLHKVGTPVASDIDIFSNENNPELAISAREFASAWIDQSAPDYVIGLAATVQSERRIFAAPSAALKKGEKLAWRRVSEVSDNLVRGLELYKDEIYSITHTNAAHYKIVRTSVKNPDWKNAETVVPETSDSIVSMTKSKSFLFIRYSNGVAERLVKYGLDTGKTRDVKLPASATVTVACPDRHSNRCILTLTGWVQPRTLYDYDGDKDTFKKSLFNVDVVYPGFDKLVSEEVEVPGHDGVMIPLSIIHRKDMKLDGSSSAILTGYGAYGYSFTPYFTILNSIAVHGVVLGIAHVRGGSEKGEAWYRAGFKTTKPNTWKDFISCGEYLIQKGYTSSGKLAGTGTSAGGILISRAVTERPDLLAAAVCNVGCANSMRMEYTTNGPANAPEFGTVKDEQEAAALYEMDGVQHVKPGVKYPAVLGVGGWNDPRVVPWQPGKFVAALQANSTSGRPVLMKVNYDNGHFSEEKKVTFANFASQYAFMLWQTGHPEFQPVK